MYCTIHTYDPILSLRWNEIKYNSNAEAQLNLRKYFNWNSIVKIWRIHTELFTARVDNKSPESQCSPHSHTITTPHNTPTTPRHHHTTIVKPLRDIVPQLHMLKIPPQHSTTAQQRQITTTTTPPHNTTTPPHYHYTTKPQYNSFTTQY